MASSGIFLVAFCVLLAEAVQSSALSLSRRAANQTILSIGVRNFGDQSYAMRVHMGKGQMFNFTLALTQAVTMVAGMGCTNCTSTVSPVYNSTASQTYVAPAGSETDLTIHYNGKNMTGGLATENCGLKETGGDWWEYYNQKVLVVESGSDSNAFGRTSGVAGFGVSGAPTFGDSILGNILTNSSFSSDVLTFCLALFGTSQKTTANGTALPGDSSGGFMHVNSADPNYYTGTISTQNVIGLSTMGSFGTVPSLLGSYDWSLQTQGWLFKNGNTAINGGQGMYATLEPAYPYIILPQHDAFTIYTTIAGARPYTVPADAFTNSGQAVYADSLSLTYQVPCDTQSIVMYVNFDGVSIPLQPQDMWTAINGICVGNIRAWSDPSRSTAILGNAFFRNAYVVFSANKNPELNTIGIANRLVAGAVEKKANRKFIVGAVIGGIVFLILIGVLASFLVQRYKRQHRIPPSALFTSQAPRSETLRSNSGDDASRTKSRTSFFGFGSTRKDASFVAEPWLPPADGIASEKITIEPWTPVDGEQAFLSPNGAADGLRYQPQIPPPSSQMSPSAMYHPPIPSPLAFGSPPVSASMSSNYHAGSSVTSQTEVLRQLPPTFSPPPTTSPQSYSQPSTSLTSYHPRSHGSRPLPQVPFGGR